MLLPWYLFIGGLLNNETKFLALIAVQIGGPGKVEVVGLVVQGASISVTTAKDIGHKKLVLLTLSARSGHRGSQVCCLEKMANLAL